MLEFLREDIRVAMARDPAARSRLEIALCYPGFHALLLHRAAHVLWTRNWRLSGRLLSELGRFLTGIEIHPGAKIGRRFFIDHGMGVVIGETSDIGDDVTIYHGVTLGGIAPSINSHFQVGQKRHPTLKDGAIVGSGAQILGPLTVGEGAWVGANAVVVADVEPGATVVGIPARTVEPRSPGGSKEFMAYGTPTIDVPDPLSQSVDELRDRVNALTERLEELDRQAEKTHEKSRSTSDESEPAAEGTGRSGASNP